MRLHLKGMGLLGSLTAWQLHHLGIEFTWEDPEDQINAWRASTGACYPSGGEIDTRCHEQWLEWSRSSIYPIGTLQSAAYWVDTAHASLPHGLVAEVQATAGSLQLVGRSVHMNAQLLVVKTREWFSSQRTTPKLGSRVVVSHGFTHRRSRYLWGWTRLVKLKYGEEVSEHGRPSFYLRKNRFQFAYCYPKPGSPWWYAGSNLISQTVAKELPIEPKYRGWRERFLELNGGVVSIGEEGPFLQGWRPAKAGGLSSEEGFKKNQGSLLEERSEGIYYPTFASNGFRHFPEVWNQLQDLLNIQ